MIPIPIVLPLIGSSLIDILPEPYKTMVFIILSIVLLILSSVFFYIIIQQATQFFKELVKRWKERRNTKIDIENKFRLQRKLMNHMYKINKEIEEHERLL